MTIFSPISVCHRWRHLARQTWISLKHLDFKGIFRAFRGTGGMSLIFNRVQFHEYLILSYTILTPTEKLLTRAGYNTFSLCSSEDDSEWKSVQERFCQRFSYRRFIDLYKSFIYFRPSSVFNRRVTQVGISLIFPSNTFIFDEPSL